MHIFNKSFKNTFSGSNFKNPPMSAGDMRQWLKKRKKKMHRHPVSPKGVLQRHGSRVAIQEAVM